MLSIQVFITTETQKKTYGEKAKGIVQEITGYKSYNDFIVDTDRKMEAMGFGPEDTVFYEISSIMANGCVLDDSQTQSLVGNLIDESYIDCDIFNAFESDIIKNLIESYITSDSYRNENIVDVHNKLAHINKLLTEIQ